MKTKKTLAEAGVLIRAFAEHGYLASVTWISELGEVQFVTPITSLTGINEERAEVRPPGMAMDHWFGLCLPRDGQTVVEIEDTFGSWESRSQWLNQCNYYQSRKWLDKVYNLLTAPEGRSWGSHVPEGIKGQADVLATVIGNYMDSEQRFTRPKLYLQDPQLPEISAKAKASADFGVAVEWAKAKLTEHDDPGCFVWVLETRDGRFHLRFDDLENVVQCPDTVAMTQINSPERQRLVEAFEVTERD